MPPTDPASLPTYWLADHVRACSVGPDVVLLDLRGGRYLSVAGPTNLALAKAIVDWPVRPDTRLEGCAHRDIDVALQTLHARHLLVTTASDRPLRNVRLPDARSSMDTLEWTGPHRATLSSAWHFLRSVAVARYWLSRLTLEHIAHRVRARRAAVPLATDAEPAGQLEGPLALFDHLRPFAFTARNKCLFDSLALVDFLASHGHHARWVMGVKTNPFRAHSWVQSGPIVLNDSHEHVRRFVPILVV